MLLSSHHVPTATVCSDVGEERFCLEGATKTQVSNTAANRRDLDRHFSLNSVKHLAHFYPENPKTGKEKGIYPFCNSSKSYHQPRPPSDQCALETTASPSLSLALVCFCFCFLLLSWSWSTDYFILLMIFACIFYMHFCMFNVWLPFTMAL